MAELVARIEVLDLPEVIEAIEATAGKANRLQQELAFVLEHGRPWQVPNESMIGEKFLMWTNHGTMLTGPLTKDFLKSGFVVGVQPYPSSPRKQQEARQ